MGFSPSSLSVASDELGGLVGAELCENLRGFQFVVWPLAGELAVHGLDEEPDDLGSVVGLPTDDSPEFLDSQILVMLVRAFGAFGLFCCLCCTHVLNARVHQCGVPRGIENLAEGGGVRVGVEGMLRIER